MRLEEDKPAGIEHTAQVSYNTAAKRVRCVPIPATGTVIAGTGTGTGTEFPTRGLPVPNPSHICIAKMGTANQPGFLIPLTKTLQLVIQRDL